MPSGDAPGRARRRENPHAPSEYASRQTAQRSLPILDSERVSVLVQVCVQSLGLDRSSNAPVVILQEQGGERVLPIWIGPGEATAIAMELAQMKFARPLTHDLLAAVLGGLGGALKKVIISRLEANTYFAEMIIWRNGEVISVRRASVRLHRRGVAHEGRDLRRRRAPRAEVDRGLRRPARRRARCGGVGAAAGRGVGGREAQGVFEEAGSRGLWSPSPPDAPESSGRHASPSRRLVSPRLRRLARALACGALLATSAASEGAGQRQEGRVRPA